MPVTPVTSVPYTPHRDHVYDFVRSRGPADLYLDVGAASGEVSLRIAADAANVLAFEPFPHNAQVFRQRLAKYQHVELIEKAVSNRRGHATFFVASTVQGDEPGWKDQVGYSSVGRIPDSLRERLKSYKSIGIAALRRRRGAQILRVETTTLDSELRGRVVDFMKVDVQGAERRLLEGAKSSLESQNIRLIYIEWTGDPEVERLLDDAGYCIYDSVYLALGSRVEFEAAGFKVLGEVPLSTGETAVELAFYGASADIGKALRELNTGDQWIQTDLIALPRDDEAEFTEFLRSS